MGSFDVEVVYDNKKVTLPLVVVQGNGPLLFGRNWLNAIKLTFTIPKLQVYRTYWPSTPMCSRKDWVRTRDKKPSDAVPRFNKARRLPYAMRTKVEEELERLVQEGTLKPVDYAAPIVAVLKSDRTSVRICGDFRMTVNPTPSLPLPKVEDLFATLADGKIFTKQLTQSQNYVVINTVVPIHEITFWSVISPWHFSATGVFGRHFDL